MARKKRERKRIPKKERKNLRLWAEGARESVLQPHFDGYVAAVDQGRVAERKFRRRVCGEFHARVDWRVADDEEPVLRDLNAPAVEEELTEDEESLKRKRIKQLNGRIRRWFMYRVRRFRKHRATVPGDPSKDPFAVLLAKLSGLKSPPKARQGWQQFSRECYETQIKSVVQEAWEKEREQGETKTREPKAGFRAKVTNALYKQLPQADRTGFEARAAAEAKAAKAAYLKALSDPPSTTPEARQECIKAATDFVAPILKGLYDHTGLHATLIMGGPMPKLGGEIRTIHVSYGRNKTSAGQHWGQWDKARFKENVQDFMIDYLKTAYTPEECAQAAAPDTSMLASAKYTIGPGASAASGSASGRTTGSAASDSDSSSSDSDSDSDSTTDSDSDSSESQSSAEEETTAKQKSRGKGKAKRKRKAKDDGGVSETDDDESGRPRKKSKDGGVKRKGKGKQKAGEWSSDDDGEGGAEQKKRRESGAKSKAPALSAAEERRRRIEATPLELRDDDDLTYEQYRDRNIARNRKIMVGLGAELTALMPTPKPKPTRGPRKTKTTVHEGPVRRSARGRGGGDEGGGGGGDGDVVMEDESNVGDEGEGGGEGRMDIEEDEVGGGGEGWGDEAAGLEDEGVGAGRGESVGAAATASTTTSLTMEGSRASGTPGTTPNALAPATTTATTTMATGSATPSSSAPLPTTATATPPTATTPASARTVTTPNALAPATTTGTATMTTGSATPSSSAPLPTTVTATPPTATTPASARTVRERGLTCPTRAARWFVTQHAAMTVVDLGPHFDAAVAAWTRLEDASRYEDCEEKLPGRGRPVQVGRWIGAGRGTSGDTKVGNARAYGKQWQKWWDSLQPDWRERGPDGAWLTGDYGGKGSEWGNLYRWGENGMLSVVASLKFWGVAVGDNEELRGVWEAAVGDATWMMEGMAVYYEKFKRKF